MPKGNYPKTKDGRINLQGVVRNGKLVGVIDQDENELGLLLTQTDVVTGGSVFSGLPEPEISSSIFHSSDEGRSARRAGSVAVRWSEGALSRTTANAGESVGLEPIAGESWLKLTPSTTPSVTGFARFDLAKPVYLGYLKSLQIPLKFADMSASEISSAKFVLWFFTTTGSVRVNAVFDKQWPNEIAVESFCQDGYLNVAQPVTDLNLDQVSRIDIAFTSGTSSAVKPPIFIGPLSLNTRGKGKVVIRMDGNYDSQHKWLLPMLERQGLRANLHLTNQYIGQAGRMTEAQLDRAYQWGHTIAHHTYGNKANGWDNATDYPDAASITADINAQWAYLQSKGWTRGIGHALHGYTNTLVSTVSNARQLLVQGAINAAGVKTVSAGGHFLAAGASGEVGHLFPYAHQQANWRGVFGGIMITNTDTAQYVKNVIDAAEDRGELAVIVIHRGVLDSATPGVLEMKLADHANWIEYLSDRVMAGGIDVQTIDEVYDLHGH